MKIQHMFSTFPAAAFCGFSVIAIICYFIALVFDLTGMPAAFHIFDSQLYFIPHDLVQVGCLLCNFAILFVIMFTGYFAIKIIYAISCCVKHTPIGSVSIGMPCLLLLAGVGLSIFAEIMQHYGFSAVDMSSLGFGGAPILTSVICVCIFVLPILSAVYWIVYLITFYSSSEDESDEDDEEDCDDETEIYDNQGN